MKRILTLAGLAGALAASGCSHAMHITNLGEYQPAPTAPLDVPRTIGLSSPNLADAASRGYVEAIADGLRRDGSFGRVLYPYDGRGDVDVVVDVRVDPRYS